MMRLHNILVLMIVSILASACNFPSLSEIVTAQGGVLFKDDFSTAESGWTVFQDEAGAAGYTPDEMFRIRVDRAQYDFWSTANVSLKNVHLDVDALKFSGPEINRIGLVCRYVDAENYYFFVISTDGFYAIGKVKDDVILLIGQAQMLGAPGIRSGAGINHLHAECVGTVLAFYVNDQLLAAVQDGDFPRGDVGLLAGTFDEAGVEVYFDNFVVTKP